MAGLRFADMRFRPTEFLDFTSLTVEEFEILIPPFEVAFEVSKIGVSEHGAEPIAHEHIRVAAQERGLGNAGGIVRHGRQRLRAERHGRPLDGKIGQRRRWPERCRLRQQYPSVCGRFVGL
jgi:hypothetical protein